MLGRRASPAAAETFGAPLAATTPMYALCFFGYGQGIVDIEVLADVLKGMRSAARRHYEDQGHIDASNAVVDPR